MKNDHNIPESNHDSGADFGLTAPREDFKLGEHFQTLPVEASGTPSKGKSKSRETAGDIGNWRGFEAEVIDEDPDIDFAAGKKIPEDDLDMTPMVDVVFLLLIFFMVTASFTLRKSFEQAHAQVEDPSTNVVDPQDDEDDFIEVIIDQTNTFYIRTRDTEEIEAPSDREMRDTLREAKDNSNAKRLIIRAHVDSLHSKVVKVLDMANSVGMERIETIVTELDY